MFNKNTYIKLEFMPDGKFLFKSNINNKTDYKPIAEFINGFLTRELLTEFMQCLYENGQKNKAEDVAISICEEVFEVQNKIEVKPIVQGRNPTIKPTQVMKQFLQGNENE